MAYCRLQQTMVQNETPVTFYYGFQSEKFTAMIIAITI